MWAWLILVIILIVAGFIFYVTYCVEYDPLTRSDLDQQTCMQMRESGWSEDEIKDFMEKHDSYYFEAVK